MNIFLELSLTIVAATVISGVMRLLKQPPIIGYLITGLIVGPQFLNIFRSTDILSTFSEMGIAILLFIVGLHLNPSELKDYGKATLVIGVGQTIISSVLGFFLSRALGFSIIPAIYIGVALSFSSTIVVLKLLTDNKELEKLHGKITIGILLVQDITAALALVTVSTFASQGSGVLQILEIIIKGIALTLGLSIVSVYILPKLENFFAKSQEYLFLFSLAWGFGLASLFNYFGFSIEIGALAAGVALSLSPYSMEISSKLKPLRDFFVVMFFIVLGSKITFLGLNTLLPKILIFSAFVLIAEPIIIMALTGLMGYSKRIGFLAGISLAQISEFSMILALLGVKLGHIDQSTLSLITFLGIVTILVSTYFINYSKRIYPFFAPFLKIFERRKINKELATISNFDVVLFGCNRVGYDFIKVFSKLDREFLAVDFDPDIVKELTEKGINCMYGDAEDSEFLDEISADKAKVVISTIPEFDTNLFLLTRLKHKNSNSIIILISYNIDEAIKLYEKGATYVIMPHFIGGQFAAKLAEEAGFDVSKLHNKRDEHISYLKERKKLGHSYPAWNRY
jgi:Kef-type K+ transport system membrane component KefB/Trk K+ transport system NAD-binding subunit